MESSKFLHSTVTTAKRVAAGIVVAIPFSASCWVDYYSLRERADELQLATTLVSTVSSRTPELERKLDVSQRQLLDLRDQLVPENKFDAFRDDLVSIVRESGCQLRRIGIGQSSTRTWHEDDSPLTPAEQNDETQTAFEFHSTPITLSVVGDMTATLSCIRKIQDKQVFQHVRRLSVSPDGPKSQLVSVGLEILVFDFGQVASNSFDEPF